MRPGRPLPTRSGIRPPRKCPNCNKERVERVCLQLPVDVTKWRCWNCNGERHRSNQCPVNSKPITAIEDGPLGFFGCVLDSEDFIPVRHGVKPRPHRATVGDYRSTIMFEQLAEKKQARRRPLPSRNPNLEIL